MLIKSAVQFVVVGLVLTGSAGAFPASAPGTSGVLTLKNGGAPVPCPKGSYSGLTCYSAQVSGCTDYLGHVLSTYSLTFGITPSHGNGSDAGVIVLNPGSDGKSMVTEPGGTNDLASDFYSAGFRVVDVSWGGVIQQTGLANEYDLKGAACRQAVFLNYIYTTYYVPIKAQANQPGYCLYGASAGAWTVAECLTRYGGYKYVDKALLASGPQFSDVDYGCSVPSKPDVTICPAGNTQCAPGATSWTYHPQYDYDGFVPGWVGTTGNSRATCVNTFGLDTAANDLAWKQMSVVDGMADATFSYPQTDVSAYLCNSTNYFSDGGLNPSSPQGWLYFQNVSGKGLLVHMADCATTKGGSTPDPELVSNAPHIDGSSTPPNFGPKKCASSWATGYAAVCDDMINSCTLNH